MKSERAVRRKHVICPRACRLRRKYKLLKQRKANEAKWKAATYVEIPHTNKIHAIPVRQATVHVEREPNAEAIARRRQKQAQQQSVQSSTKKSTKKSEKETNVEKQTVVDLKSERSANELASPSNIISINA